MPPFSVQHHVAGLGPEHVAVHQRADQLQRSGAVLGGVGQDQLLRLTIIKRADDALYHAKESGRNRVCLNLGEGSMFLF